MSKKKLGVIFGGKSGEHDVSLMSATSVLKAIDQEKYDIVTIGITRKGKWLLYEGPIEAIISGDWQKKAEEDLLSNPAHFQLCILGESGNKLKDLIDFALPILHGPNGEDGTVQGLMELLDLPYGGCSVLGAATAMDKVVAKKLFAAEGLRQAKYITLHAKDLEEGSAKICKRVREELGYPVFVKPSNMGSSVGITKVSSEEKLPEALSLAAEYDYRILVEKGINCRELETAVIGNYTLTLGAVGEILPAGEYYDYKSKYYDAASKICIPADISQEAKAELQDMARRAFVVLGCEGYARVDFLMDKDTQKVYINEINAIPGFTHASMFPLLCMEIGMTYPEIIERIVELGYERYHAKNHG
ncbi:MAG: D-alanine--D-alanine ligase [Clostridia bacterium]|nr:D-alanine--D-alanine ligase [Clostridia bacterium]